MTALPRPDRPRSQQLLTCAAAVCAVAVPTLWRPRFEPGEEPPTVIQPAPYTFAVWLPIFASSLGFAAYQARPAARNRGVLRDIRWPLTGAFVSTAVWAPLVRTRRYWAAQSALGAIAAFAEAGRWRVAELERRGALSKADRWATIPLSGMLSAWGLTATGVNLAAMLADRGLLPPGRTRALSGAGLLLGLGVAGAAATTATGGASSATAKTFAGTMIWGLTGVIAGQRKRSPITAGAAAAAALVLVAGARGPVPRGTRA